MHSPEMEKRDFREMYIYCHQLNSQKLKRKFWHFDGIIVIDYTGRRQYENLNHLCIGESYKGIIDRAHDVMAVICDAPVIWWPSREYVEWT